MVWNTSAFQLLIISGPGGFTGLFLYSPAPPGSGNLLDSIAPPLSPGSTSGGTDPYGNVYRAGITSYAPGASLVELVNGGISMALTGGTPSLRDAQVRLGISGSGEALILTSGNTNNIPGVGTSTMNLGEAVSTQPGLYVIDGADANNYATERLTLETKIVQTITGANQVILSAPVAARTYRFSGMFRIKQGAGANVTDNVGFSGPASSFCVWYFQTNNASPNAGGGTAPTGWTPVGSLTTLGAGGTLDANNEQYIIFEHGEVTFTAAGTFAMIGTVSTANFIVQPGTVFNLEVV